MKNARSIRLVALLLALALVVACAAPPSRGGGDALAELLAADRAFAETARTAGQDVEKVLPFWADDALMLFSGGTRRAAGKDEIRDYVTRMRSDPGFSITWNVEGGGVAESGELGYTYGVGRVTFSAEEGTQEAEANYLAVWRRDPDGTWRVVVDG